MKRRIIFFIFMIFSIIQAEDDYLSNHLIMVPSIQTASGNYFTRGFSQSSSFPGFYSEIGQHSFYFKDAKDNLYSLGIGFVYINVGFHKYLRDNWYLNMNYSIRGGSVGLSKIYELENDIAVEISPNLFIDQGMHGFIGFVPYVKGIVNWVNFVKYFDLQVMDTGIHFPFQVSAGFGVAIAQYRRGYNAYDGWHMISRDQEDNFQQTTWRNYVTFPFRFTISFDIHRR